MSTISNREQIAAIAAQLGLSRSTVYFALAGTGTVSEQTQVRVREAAQKLGYQPDRNARVLRTGRTNTIGVVLPVVYVNLYEQIIRTLATTAVATGYRILFTYSFESAAVEREALTYFMESKVEGLIIMTHNGTANYAVYKKAAKMLPLVFIESLDLIGQFDMVYVDQFAIGYEAGRDLIQHGRQRLAYLHPMSEDGRNDWWNRERLRGFAYAMQEMLGISPVELGLQTPSLTAFNTANQCIRPDDAILLTLPHEHYAWQVVKNELATIRQHDGIFAANDGLAHGAIRALTSSGIDVPTDIAIIGCDNIPMDPIYSPPLTSIRQPMGELGTEAIKLLIERINHPDAKSKPRELALQPELMARASCGEQILVANV